MIRAPFGSWPSPLSASALAQGSIQLGDLRAVNGELFWWESRPAEGGRYVVVTPDGKDGIRELIAPPFNSRTRVHEYGGIPYVVSGGKLYFSNFADQRLYVCRPGEAPVALTPPGYRYADCVADASGKWLYAVREDHTGAGEPRNEIVAVPTSGGHAGHVLFGSSDFVAFPRLSHDGRRIAWIAWNHPDMPWDATSLYVAELSGNSVTNVTKIAGGERESVLEPSWDTDGTLYFISDRSNWWNLYRWRGNRVEAVAPMEAEFSGALWVLGQASYALTGDGRAVVRIGVRSRESLAVLDLKTGALRQLDLPFVSFASVQLLSPDTAVAIAASERQPAAVVRINLNSAQFEILRMPNRPPLAPDMISVGEPIEFPTSNGATAHAFFYPPTNPGYAGLEGEKPPLLVEVHGGPTAQTRPILDIRKQFWTSRGFAIVDVNYRGSAGFGRRYREALNGNWGVVDVDDVAAAVEYLAKTGRIDPQRAAIRGGSAGGYTTLAALALKDVFRAGANYYGVSDLEALARDTHKFESRYLDRLIGPLPEAHDLYTARSPLSHLDKFTSPLITFQGSEDRVVPPEQSRAIVQALAAKGVPVEYIEFEGEQHGFRKAESIIRAAEAELAFYGKIFGFKPAL